MITTARIVAESRWSTAQIPVGGVTISSFHFD